MKKFVSLVSVLFVSSFIFAAPPKSDKGNIPPEPPQKHQQQMKLDFEKISKELKITDEQKQKINELMKTDLEKKRELRQQIKEKSTAIDEELMKEKFDIYVVNKLSEEIQQLNAEIAKINIESKLNVRSILTFEQYSRMEQARKQTMENFKQEKINHQKKEQDKKQNKEQKGKKK
ncbi:MAG: Spy/CpxP family protein refolding chaperone [Elusimicrobia bacterium]|nr:Spy/CpxP family protein refolding chaperone [Elusimicrobiota bacterium]